MHVLILAEGNDKKIIKELIEEHKKSIIFKCYTEEYGYTYLYLYNEAFYMHIKNLENNESKLTKSLLDLYMLFIKYENIVEDDIDNYKIFEHMPDLWIATDNTEINDINIIDIRISLHKDSFNRFLYMYDKILINILNDLINNFLEPVMLNFLNNTSKMYNTISVISNFINEEGDYHGKAI